MVSINQKLPFGCSGFLANFFHVVQCNPTKKREKILLKNGHSFFHRRTFNFPLALNVNQSGKKKDLYLNE